MMTTVTKMSQICMFNSKTVAAHFAHEFFTCEHLHQFTLSPQHEMTSFAVTFTMSAHDDKFSIFSCYLQTADTNLIPGHLEYFLQAYIMTSTDWEIIAETRSYTFIWCSFCRRCCVCFSSLISTTNNPDNTTICFSWKLLGLTKYIISVHPSLVITWKTVNIPANMLSNDVIPSLGPSQNSLHCWGGVQVVPFPSGSQIWGVSGFSIFPREQKRCGYH